MQADHNLNGLYEDKRLHNKEDPALKIVCQNMKFKESMYLCFMSIDNSSMVRRSAGSVAAWTSQAA